MQLCLFPFVAKQNIICYCFYYCCLAPILFLYFSNFSEYRFLMTNYMPVPTCWRKLKLVLSSANELSFLPWQHSLLPWYKRVSMLFHCTVKLFICKIFAQKALTESIISTLGSCEETPYSNGRVSSQQANVLDRKDLGTLEKSQFNSNPAVLIKILELV